jgi:mRNA interferase RelE/StbE
MKIYYRKRFLKELSKIPPKTRMRMEKFVFEELPEANSIVELRKVEQLKGYASYHKIRFGSYRIGLKLENQTVILERALHRKDIYRFFP